MLNGSTIYALLDYTCKYQYIAPSPEVHKKSAFVTPFRKFDFKKEPFDIAEAQTHFQQLINEILKSLCFALGYLDDNLVNAMRNV